MVSKIRLIFLVTLTAEISIATGFSSKIKRTYSLQIAKKTVPKDIIDLVNLVTLNETLIFWNKSHFHDCFNRESYPYNLAVLQFLQELEKSLKNFMSVTNDENRHFVHENYRCVKENYNLMEQGRNNIYLITQRPDSVDKSLKDAMDRVKAGLILNFKRLTENFPKIRKGANTVFQDKDLTKIEQSYKTKVQNIKSASIQFVASIKLCMGIQNNT